jgi:glucans biosynthesis protein C
MNRGNLMTPLTDSRRYDIDWLRTLAFMLLIFYHIGQFYVTDWGWHVKSAYQSEFLKNIMLMVNQWRMPLIFLISGVALALVEPKINNMQLLKTRFVRVLIPLVIGMYLIVPPQLFFELIQNNNFTGSYWEFFTFYVDADTQMFPEKQYSPLGLLTWNHLWYLAYLWHYTLVYLMLKPLLTPIDWNKLTSGIPGWAIVIFLSLLLSVYTMYLEPLFPKTHALIGDWYNHAYSFTFFMGGYMLAKSPDKWNKIVQTRRVWLVLSVIGYIVIILRFNRVSGFDMDYASSSEIMKLALHSIWSLNKLFWILMIIGYAGRYLNKKSTVLSYMNEAILPWYILHQSVIIIAAMTLANYSLGGFVEPLLVVIVTFALCAVGYELIKRNNLTRFAFGMKLRTSDKSSVSQVVELVK